MAFNLYDVVALALAIPLTGGLRLSTMRGGGEWRLSLLRGLRAGRAGVPVREGS